MPSPRRRRAAALLAFSSAVCAGACTLITGEHDRFLRSDDGSAPPEGHADATTSNPNDDGGASDASDAMAAPDVFVVGNTWNTYNGARWTYVAGRGTHIDAIGNLSGSGHAIIYADPQPPLPSDDYTVEATVHAISDGGPGSYPEFGIVARIDGSKLDDDAGVVTVLSSSLGGGNVTWLGTMGPPPWSPSLLSQSQTPHPAGGDRRYKFVLRVHGTNISGKMWDVTTPEPVMDEVSYPARRATGRGVGFYIYPPGGVIPNAWLEDMRVTVP